MKQGARTCCVSLAQHGYASEGYPNLASDLGKQQYITHPAAMPLSEHASKSCILLRSYVAERSASRTPPVLRPLGAPARIPPAAVAAARVRMLLRCTSSRDKSLLSPRRSPAPEDLSPLASRRWVGRTVSVTVKRPHTRGRAAASGPCIPHRAYVDGWRGMLGCSTVHPRSRAHEERPYVTCIAILSTARQLRCPYSQWCGTRLLPGALPST
ncbi:hypothetical protein OH77DRAFT_1259563 [Trametes cingulata]|nr:hypothetical protein OH77DRAFT_1259563 [Trametes cingulata]